jgi:hypothetical protein
VFTELFQHPAGPFIAAFEKQLGISLPAPYRRFLEQHNGAEFNVSPQFPIDPPDEADGDGQLFRLYGLVKDGVTTDPYGLDLREARNVLRFRDRVPKDIIAIGESPYDERIALSIAGDDRGTVYFWRPGLPFEEREEDNVPTRQYLHVAARDFGEFWRIVTENAKLAQRTDGQGR